jgi:hypothetical protein
MQIHDLVASLNPWWQEPGARPDRSRPVRRDLQPRLLRQLLDLEDRRAFALAGARQMGKTTMLWQVVADLLERGWPPGNVTYFDFSDIRVTQAISPSDVAEVSPSLASGTHPRVLLLDEISRAEHWDRWLKGAVDRGGFRIGVTDSAASLLRSGAVESGQGRWDEIRVGGLNFREFLRLSAEEGEEPEEALARLPNLFERYLALGGFPEHVTAEDFRRTRQRIRDDVVNRAIYRDLSRAGVDVERVRRLFVFLAQESGSIFKLKDRAEQVHADTRPVRHWLSLLDEAALIARLPRHAVKASSRMRGAEREKVYMSDHGMVTAFSLTGMDDPEVRSRVFEAVVFRHLRELERTVDGRVSVFRPEEDLEIDFVFETGRRRVAIEVTSSSGVKGKKLDRLLSAAHQVSSQERILIFGGVTRAEERGVEVTPLRDFLLDPAGALKLEAE